MPRIMLNSEEKENKRVQNIEEKVYFLCFSKPRSRTEIAKILYGPKSSKNKSAYAYLSGKTGIMEKLADEKIGWLEYLPNYKPILGEGKKIDRRSLNRKYYGSVSDPLISRIKQKASLDEFEEYVLRDKFNSSFFRTFVGNSLPSDPNSFPSNPFEYIISLMDIVFIEIDENIGLRELNIQLSSEIQIKKQYNTLKRNINKVMKEKLPELAGVYFDKDIKRKEGEKIEFVGGTQKKKSETFIKPSLKDEDSLEWMEKFLIFLIIPDILFHKIMTISNFGVTIYGIKRRLDASSTLGKFYLEKLSLK